MELQLIWGWQPALYLFLGGLGAGAFVVAACLFFLGKDKHESALRRKSLCIVSWTAMACLIIGLMLLLTELTFPLRGMMMWQSFTHFTSWMTVGAWLLFVTVIFIFVAALALTAPVAKALKLEGKDGLLKACFGVGGVLSLGVCVYTGILLMSAPGVPLWNTLLLPCLFTISALDTGVALNEIVLGLVERKEADRCVHKRLVLTVLVLVVLEMIVVAAFVATMKAGGGYAQAYAAQAAKDSAVLLTTGVLSGWFWWAFVALGLIVPLACALAGLKVKGTAGEALTFTGAACALFGGCVLRFVILLAGIHADVIATAVAGIVF